MLGLTVPPSLLDAADEVIESEPTKILKPSMPRGGSRRRCRCGNVAGGDLANASDVLRSPARWRRGGSAAGSFCALCCESIGENSLRDITTRLSYYRFNFYLRRLSR